MHLTLGTVLVFLTIFLRPSGDFPEEAGSVTGRDEVISDGAEFLFLATIR